MIDCVKVQPLLFVFKLTTIGASFFYPFWTLLELFLELVSGSKKFLGPTYASNQLWFWKYSPIFFS